MTLEGKLGKFLHGEAVLHTPTQEIFDELMKVLEEHGCRWASGKKPTGNYIFYDNGMNTCISAYAGVLHYGRVQKFFNDHREILELTEDDFSTPPKSTRITKEIEEVKSDIEALRKLNDKYLAESPELRQKMERKLYKLLKEHYGI